MLIVNKLSDIPSFPHPCGLTIGSFDGVHQGHIYLLKTLREKVTKQGTLAVLTFRNHPSTIIKKGQVLSQICTPAHKWELLKKCGVDLLILLDFTQEMAGLSFDLFLEMIKDAYPFSFLVLGEGATIGKDRQGNEENVRRWEGRLQFKAQYLPKASWKDEPISSNRIRNLLSAGDLHTVAELLGRPYSIYGTFLKEENAPSQYYFPLEGMSLLPEGAYRCLVKTSQKELHATALLSHFPPKLSLNSDELSNSFPWEVIFL